MKRFAKTICAALALVSAVNATPAWAGLLCGGNLPPCYHHPCGKAFKKEEARLNRFWHDYYSALHCYYGHLSHVDWVAYYKNHAQPNTPCNPCGGFQPVTYTPVIVYPQMHWGIPGPAPVGPPVVVNGFQH